MNKNDVVLETLLDLSAQNKGMLTPKFVVDTARKAESPLHAYFDWNDSTAGEQWRLQQARQLIGKVTITMEDREVHAFQNAIITINDEPVQGYWTSEDVSTNEELKKQVLYGLLGDIKGLQDRCKEVEGLDGLFNPKVIKKFEQSVASL